MLSVSVIWCNNIEALKNCASKWSWSATKIVKIFEWPVLPYSFSPIDCSAINQTYDRLVKVMGFLTGLKGYNYDCNIESEAKIPNPFKESKLILEFISSVRASVRTFRGIASLFTGRTTKSALNQNNIKVFVQLFMNLICFKSARRLTTDQQWNCRTHVII